MILALYGKAMSGLPECGGVVIDYKILLVVHVLAGFTSLAAATVATFSKTLDLAHRWHVISGTVFFWGMLVIFLTAVPMSIIRPNTFLFLIAMLSFYFALAGWRYATNRLGTPRPLDWTSAGTMLLAALAMLSYGGFLISGGNLNGITMLVLGTAGGSLSIADLRTLRQGGAKGPERIAKHLSMMLAGAIATTTAFVVTNIPFTPGYIAWLAPTVLTTPIIFVWARQIRNGKMPRGMPSPGASAT